MKARLFFQRAFLSLLIFACAQVQAQVSWLFRAPKDLAEVDRVIAEKFPAVKHTSTQELAKLLGQADPPLLLDVRAPAEFEVSHLQGAVRVIDVASAQAEINKVRASQPQRTVVLYCSVGYRSAELVAQLQKSPDKAYSQNLYNLKGSIFQWANEGRTLVSTRGESPVPASFVHPYSQKWSGLLAPHLRAPL